jgi:hypothetical protein
MPSSLLHAQFYADDGPTDIVNFHPGGIRYFLYPLLAFATSLGWLVVRQAQQGRFRGHPGGVGLRRVQAEAVRLAGLGAALVLLLAAVEGAPRTGCIRPTSTNTGPRRSSAWRRRRRAPAWSSPSTRPVGA